MHYALGLGLLLLSFFQNFSTVPWRAAHSEIFAFLAVLLLSWSAVRSRTLHVCQTPPVTGLLCFSILIGLQYFAGLIFFAGDAITLLIYVQLCLFALLTGQVLAEDPKWPLALALTLIFAAVGSALIALAQALWVWIGSGWIWTAPWYRRPGANLGQPNLLATLLVMGTASLIYLDQRLKMSRPLLMLLSLMLLIGMGIAESRTGLLSGVALSVWWFGRRKVFALMPQWQWIGGSVVALVAVMWIWPPLITFIHAGGLSADSVALDTTAGMRTVMWPQLCEAIWLRPWIGWGIRGTSVALSAVLGTQPVSEPYTYAHNIILDMAIGMGLPLALLAVSALGIWGWTRLCRVRTPEDWYAVGLLIPFVMHCMFEYPYAYAYFLVPVMLAIGLLEWDNSPLIGKSIPRRIFAGSLALFAGLLVWMSVEYIEVEEDFRVARFEAVNVGETPAEYERPHIVLLTQLRALLEVTRTVPRPNMSHEDLLLLQSTASRFPWVPVQNGLALSMALNGDVPEAQRQLRVMRAMHGEKRYAAIRAQWDAWAQDKYPQLRGLAPP